MFFCVSASNTYAKKHVCSITIHSSDELMVFKRNLPRSKFKFTELTKLSKGNDWFAKACAKKIKCDVLIVSGHFGGSFFGKSNKSLSMDTLESASCSRKCAGILNYPKEVFLFGCNTLATKKRDHRSIEEYTQILTQDGFSIEHAQRIAEARYGFWGDSFSERMQAVFSKVPRIYGFRSVAPLGHSIKHLLENYIRSVPDYSKHLSELRIKNRTFFKSEIELYQAFSNKRIFRALKTTNFRQVSGLMRFQRKATYKKKLQCRLYSEVTSTETKLRTALKLMNDRRFTSYFPAFEKFFRTLDILNLSDESRRIFSNIREHGHAKKLTINLIRLIRSPTLKLDIILLAEKIGWILPNQADRQLKSIIKKLYRSRRFNQESKDSICSITKKKPKIASDFTMKDIGKVEYNVFRLMSYECSRFKNIEIQNKILRLFDLSTSAEGDEDFSYRIRALSHYNANRDKVIKTLIQVYRGTTSNVNRMYIYRAFKYIRPKSDEVKNLLLSALHYDRKNAAMIFSAVDSISVTSSFDKIKMYEIARLYRNSLNIDKALNILARIDGSSDQFAKLLIRSYRKSKSVIRKYLILDKIAYYQAHNKRVVKFLIHLLKEESNFNLSLRLSKTIFLVAKKNNVMISELKKLIASQSRNSIKAKVILEKVIRSRSDVLVSGRASDGKYY